MYAIIEVGGKQFSVEKGTKVRCEKLDKDVNTSFPVERVLMVKDGEKVQFGQPFVKGVQVMAKVTDHDRTPKLVGLKYKHKINYRKHYGHRQHFTTLLIEDIKA